MDSDESWLLRLDQLRRTSEIRIDEKGGWWHANQPFEHERVIDALNKGLDWRSEMPENTDSATPLESWCGEATVSIGSQWCYVDYVFTPFLVTKLRTDEDAKTLIAKLNTGEEYRLGPLALYQDIVFSRLHFNRLARFSVYAQLQTMDWLREDERGGLMIEHQGTRWPIVIIENT